MGRKSNHGVSTPWLVRPSDFASVVHNELVVWPDALGPGHAPEAGHGSEAGRGFEAARGFEAVRESGVGHATPYGTEEVKQRASGKSAQRDSAISRPSRGVEPPATFDSPEKFALLP